ncbi:hypothetical protein HK096_009111, partial [Nowakowskiella sp. JEL0078]
MFDSLPRASEVDQDSLRKLRSSVSKIVADAISVLSEKSDISIDSTLLNKHFTSFLSNDATLSRYLRAYSGSVEKAVVAIGQTLVWRHEFKTDTITIEEVYSELEAGNNYVNEFDRFGRPIVYLKKRGKIGDPVKNVRALVLVLEQAIS